MARGPWSDYVPPSPKPPDLMPVFGSQVGWSPDRTCEDVHPHGPIPPGSVCCCMACHRSGVERSVRDHTKPGDGQLREGWKAAKPTRYAPDAAEGPGGRGAAPRPAPNPKTKGKPTLKGGHR